MRNASNAKPTLLPDDGLLDRFHVVVDEDAEPADLDEAFADFLLRHVRHKRAISQELSGARQNPERAHDRKLPK